MVSGIVRFDCISWWDPVFNSLKGGTSLCEEKVGAGLAQETTIVNLLVPMPFVVRCVLSGCVLWPVDETSSVFYRLSDFSSVVLVLLQEAPVIETLVFL